jgi:oxygen-independent coproporphyrinogen-3 oxidase
MVQAMVREIELKGEFLDQAEELATIYFGGGTPSILSPSELSQLFEAISKHFNIAEGAEVTLEANPDNMAAENLNAWRSIGINRLSVGIQSFRQADMAWMRRSHSVAQAEACVKLARKAGFDNLSLDLIFGGPDLSLADWRENLESLFAFEPEHISLYALTIEEKTMLHNWVQREKLEPASDEIYQQQFLLAHELATAEGYEHYEVSNFARPGYRSRHNSSYWKGIPYLGIGPSAHSYDGTQRSWNISNNFKYIQSLQEGKPATAEKEELSLNDRYHEHIMTGLRRVEGIDLEEVKALFGIDISTQFSETLSPLLQQKQMWLTGSQLGFEPEGWIISDEIISRFFV